MKNLREKLPVMRHCAVWLLAVGLYYSGLLDLFSWWRRRVLCRREAVVIGLHRVLPPEDAARSLSEPAIILLFPTFKNVLRVLRQSYKVLAANELDDLEHADNSRPLCLITFDDGWRDTFENACPALQELGLPATLFLTTGLVSQPTLFWAERVTRVWKQAGGNREDIRDQLRATLPNSTIVALPDAIAALKTIPSDTREELIGLLEARFASRSEADPVDSFMTWEQVKAAANIFEIASHTSTHPLLTYEDEQVVERELTTSKLELERRLKKPIRAFAYPSGDFDEGVKQAVAKAGYSFAFTTRAGIYRHGDEQLAIPRILLHEGTVTGIHGRFSPALLHFRLMGWKLRWS